MSYVSNKAKVKEAKTPVDGSLGYKIGAKTS